MPTWENPFETIKEFYEIYYNGYSGDFCYLIVLVRESEDGEQTRTEVSKEDSIEKAYRYVHYYNKNINNSFGVKIL